MEQELSLESNLNLFSIVCLVLGFALIFILLLDVMTSKNQDKLRYAGVNVELHIAEATNDVARLSNTLDSCEKHGLVGNVRIQQIDANTCKYSYKETYGDKNERKIILKNKDMK